jgi:hypothetical protein
MPSIVESITDATVAALTGGTWSQSFTTEGSYADWELPFEGAGAVALRCDVVPHPELPTELEDRQTLQYEVGVELVLRQRFGGADLETDGRVKKTKVAALISLLLELNRFFTADRFATFQDAVWTETRIKMLYSPRHLRTHHQFTGIVRLIFEANEVFA